LVIIAAAPNLAVALVGSVVLGAGFSLLHPSLALMVMNRTDPAHQGAALGTYTSFWDLGLAVWGPLTGVVASGFGYPAVFVAGAVAAVAAAALALVASADRTAD
jgi:MFS family permease